LDKGFDFQKTKVGLRSLKYRQLAARDARPCPDQVFTKTCFSLVDDPNRGIPRVLNGVCQNEGPRTCLWTRWKSKLVTKTMTLGERRSALVQIVSPDSVRPLSSDRPLRCGVSERDFTHLSPAKLFRIRE
jgi:hypothetical protein